MTKAEKFELVDQLAQDFAENPNFYVLNMSGLSVSANNAFRGKLYEAGYKVTWVKNTLLKKALERQDQDFTELYPALAESSSILFTSSEQASQPAKLIKAFRDEGRELPVLKAAVIEEATYVGDEQLKELTKLKSKDQLIGELVDLLQSPMRNVMGSLQGAGHTLSGLLKAMSERNS
jgi:large subunit ribosomal protein L10